jgi:hypothetical protein
MPAGDIARQGTLRQHVRSGIGSHLSAAEYDGKPPPAVAARPLVLACEDRIVFRDRPLMPDLPAGAGSFVGYANNETKLMFGNNSPGPGGWPATRDPRYRDVQCENCHGPGEAHVRNPDGSTAAAMLARVNAGGALQFPARGAVRVGDPQPVPDGGAAHRQHPAGAAGLRHRAVEGGR